MTNGSDSAMPVVAENYLGHVSDGLTKRELMFTQILCAYIAAGSNGMPDVDRLIEYARNTYQATINELNKQP